MIRKFLKHKILLVAMLLFCTAWPPSTRAASSLTTAQVSCDTTSGGVQLLAASKDYLGWKITNTSSSLTVYIGPSGLTTSTGDVLLPGQSIGDGGSKAYGRQEAVGNAIYCITASSSATVAVSMWKK